MFCCTPGAKLKHKRSSSTGRHRMFVCIVLYTVVNGSCSHRLAEYCYSHYTTRLLFLSGYSVNIAPLYHCPSQNCSDKLHAQGLSDCSGCSGSRSGASGFSCRSFNSPTNWSKSSGFKQNDQRPFLSFHLGCASRMSFSDKADRSHCMGSTRLHNITSPMSAHSN